MRLMKRWGVMTLVALLVLGTMGAALADEPATEADTAKAPPEPDTYVPIFDWAMGLVDFVFYWGLDEAEEGVAEDDCPVAEASAPTSWLLQELPLAADPPLCVTVNVEKNGHVNHGSMVSAVVHWLKSGGMELLPEEYQDMPKGQLVKEFAHLDFGKGSFEFPDPDDSLEATDGDADADGHGPPEWAKNKKDKKAEKADKGKNK